jgi:hypothetical protein
MRIMARVEDLVQRIEDGRTGRVLNGRVIERPGGVVCGLHRTRGDEKSSFLVEPQNQGRRFLMVWHQNLLRRFLVVWAQNLL